MQEVRDRVRGEQLLETVKAGRALPANSPGGKALLASYKRWQQGEAAKASDTQELQASLDKIEGMLSKTVEELAKARASAAVPTPEVTEDRAQTTSIRAMQSALKSEATVGAAIAAGYKAYKGAGGRLTDAAWRKSLR
jgi:hypothetical protein